ncbi:MAG: hypothetical protein RIM84_07150 [Alphaproteobacteria bacterium]
MGMRLAATALFLVLSTQVAFAQMPPPADSNIKSVYADLDKYEGQIQSNQSKSTAKRVLRLLSITDGRLRSSKNQSDASWVAAEQRLAALQEKLNAIIEGRPAAQQAAPAKPAPAQQAAPAAAPVQSGDPKVQAAAAEIARISGLVDQMQPGDKANGQKYLNDLKAVGNQLRGIGTKDAAWNQAAQNYNALQKRILEVANAPAAAGGTGQTAQQPATQQPAQQAAPSNKPDPNTERAMRELKFAERNVRNLRADDVRGEQRVLAELQRIGESLGKIQDRSHPSWQEAVDYRAGLYRQMAEKRIGSLAKQMDSTEKAVRNSPPVEFLNQDLLAKMNNVLANYDRQLQVYAAYKDDPAFKDQFDRPVQIADLMDEMAAKAQASEGELGDVVAEVQAIDNRMKNTPIPVAPRHEEMSPETMKAWVDQILAAKAQAAKDAAYIEKIKGRTDKISKNDLQRLSYWVGQDRPRKIEESLQQMNGYFSANWPQHQRTLEWHAEDDPEDRNHQANRFVGEGRYDENMKRFNEIINFLDTAEVYEAAVGIDSKAERAKQREMTMQAIAKYQSDYKIAVGAVRMNKGVDDDELREIARQVLESGRYEDIGEIVRVETTKKSRRKEERGSISGTVTGASVTSSVYEWDEFQAHTIEKHGDQYFIFHSTIKYFYSGGRKTPLDRWLVSGRFKGNPILAENIEK